MLSSVVAVTISGAFVFGMIVVLLGSIRELLSKRLGASEAQVDWLFVAFNLTLIPMMLASGILIDKFGIKNVFIIGSLITAGAVFVLAVSTGLKRALGSVMLAGAGGACLSTGSTVLMSDAFYPDFIAASQNLGNVFFGLGALLTPKITDWLIERYGFKRTLSFLAIVCLLPALAAAFPGSNEFTFMAPRDLAEMFREPVLWMIGLVLLLYIPVETSLGTWATRYLTDLGIGPNRARWLLTGFWLAFLGSRLLASFVERRYIVDRVAQEWLVVGLGLAAAMALGNLAGGPRRSGAVIGILLAGAFFGPIFPTLVGVLFEEFQEGRGTAYGAMFAIAAAGNLFTPPIIGAYARRTNVRNALRIPLVLMLAMSLLALVLTLFTFKR